MIKAIVYSRDNCQKCRITENKLSAGGINVELRQIDNHDDIRALMETEGRMALPYVEIWRDGEDEPDYRWSDLRMTHIRNAIEMGKA